MARTQDGITAPFSDPVYLKAAALDPAFSLLWVEPHVLVNRDIKAEVAQRVKAQTCEDILIMGGKRILNPAVLFAEHREVHPELRPQGLQVFCDGICHRIRNLPFLLNEKF
ncbi:unnamed protein product [Gadus morhua 'NCC']